jgi:hypothetical protein
VTVPDEVSLGEVGRTLVRVEAALASEVRRLEREHRADMERLERDHARDLAAVRDEVKVVRDRPWLTTGRIVAIVMAVVALATLLVTAYGTFKGAAK